MCSSVSRWHAFFPPRSSRATTAATFSTITHSAGSFNRIVAKSQLRLTHSLVDSS